jgi:hypothetical protein
VVAIPVPVGFALALGAVAALIASMQRQRERLADLLLRFEGPVEPDQRLRVRYLTRMSDSLFYAHHPLHHLDRAVVALEEKIGITVGGTEGEGGRFSLLFNRQLANVTARIETLDALVSVESPEAPDEQADEVS